jgi:hypothetical protein
VDFLEKLVATLAFLAILVAGATIGFFTFAVDLSSGVSREEVTATLAVADWVELEQRRVSPPRAERVNLEQPRPSSTEPLRVDPCEEPRPGLPAQYRTAKQEGWTYTPPRPIPELVYRATRDSRRPSRWPSRAPASS